MTIVLDSSVLIARALTDEPLHTKADQALAHWKSNHIRLIAPMLLRSEVTAVLRKTVYQGRASHEQGRLLLSGLLAYRVEYFEDDALLTSAYELARRFNRPRAYDSQYLALAERMNCEFWTADEVLVNSIQAQFNRIRWLGKFTP